MANIYTSNQQDKIATELIEAYFKIHKNVSGPLELAVAAYYMLGLICERRKDLEQAIDHYRLAVHILDINTSEEELHANHPFLMVLINRLVWILNEQNRLEDSYQYTMFIIHGNLDIVNCLLTHGIIFHHMGQRNLIVFLKYKISLVHSSVC